MKKILFIAALFLLSNTLVHAQEAAPFDFKGIALKSSLSAIKDDPRFRCSEPRDKIYDQICFLNSSAMETIAGAPIKTLMLLYYFDRLESIYITFGEKNFLDVASALNEKYGSVDVQKETVHNKAGASFENRTYKWGRNGAILTAERYGSDLATSKVEFRTDFSLQEFTRRTKAADKKKASDL